MTNQSSSINIALTNKSNGLVKAQRKETPGDTNHTNIGQHSKAHLIANSPAKVVSRAGEISGPTTEDTTYKEMI